MIPIKASICDEVWDRAWVAINADHGIREEVWKVCRSATSGSVGDRVERLVREEVYYYPSENQNQED